MKPFIDPKTQAINFPRKWLTIDGSVFLWPIRINLFGAAFAVAFHLGILAAIFPMVHFGLKNLVAPIVLVTIPVCLCLLIFSTQALPLYADKRICDAGIAHVLIMVGLIAAFAEAAIYYWFNGRPAFFGLALLLESIMLMVLVSPVTETRRK